ncbi:MAG: hypothetical protein AUJ88_09020 [Gallionellaceae bacterium CG1_02_56_997]|nr:MAG: hypothetical protein AUJ88_09020 [Gallionellaceae bacterium CG1_02_56_997]
MLILRIYLVLTTLLLVLNVAMYVFTRKHWYLNFSWKIVRFTVLLLLIFALLFVLERYVLVGWRVLL